MQVIIKCASVPDFGPGWSKSARNPDHTRRLLILGFGIGEIMTHQLQQFLKSAVVLIALACASFAQHMVGTLRGQVSDQLGAVIIGATVTAREPQPLSPTTAANSCCPISRQELMPFARRRRAFLRSI